MVLADAPAATGVAGGGAAASTEAEWLEWTRGDGAASCPDGAEFAAQVAGELGGSPAEAASRGHRKLSVRIQRAPGAAARWTAELRLLGEDGAMVGSRALERGGDSCQPLADALALMASLLLGDASAAASEPAPATPTPPVATATAGPAPTAAASATATPTRTPPPPPTPVPVTPAPPPASPPARAAGVAAARPPRATEEAAVPAPRSADWAISADVGPVVAVGLLPDVGLAAEARVAVTPPAGPDLFASASAWRTDSVSLDGGSGARVGLVMAGLGVCPLARRAPTRAVAGCLGVEGGRLSASGYGFDNAFTNERWTADVTLGAELRQRLGGALFVAFGLRAVVPLVRDRVVYGAPTGETRELFRMWPLALIAGLRVGYGGR